MALRYNTTLRNSLANALSDNFGAGSLLYIYTGAQPASANTAASGTLLCTITLPATPWAAAVNGAIAKQGTWSGTAVATGTAGYARLTDDSAVNMDFTVGESGADATIDNASIVSGGTVTINTLTYTVPSGE
jgi:hypothetical protein